MADNVPKKHIALDKELQERLDTSFLLIPDYGKGVKLFTTEDEEQALIDYNRLAGLNYISTATIDPSTNKPTSLLIKKNGWIHVDGRCGVKVMIDGLVVCRSNDLVHRTWEYSYATGLFPVRSGMTVTWQISASPSPVPFLSLTFIPNVTV